MWSECCATGHGKLLACYYLHIYKYNLVSYKVVAMQEGSLL